MSDTPRDGVTNELIFETLKAMQATLANHSQEFLEVKQRLGILEQQYASLSSRLDRLDERVRRIERRLDLQEA